MARNAEIPPCCTDLDGDLIGVFEPLPPGIDGSERDLSNNFSAMSIGKGEPAIGALGEAEEQGMFALGKASKGSQPAVCSQALDKRRIFELPG